MTADKFSGKRELEVTIFRDSARQDLIRDVFNPAASYS